MGGVSMIRTAMAFSTLVLLAGAPASASFLIDFENQALGPVAFPLDENPNFIQAQGDIIDVGGSHGKVWHLRGDPSKLGTFTRFLIYSSRNGIDFGTVTSPGNLTMDFFAPNGGRLSGVRADLPVATWTTVRLGLGNFNGGYLFAHRYGGLMIDNIRYDMTSIRVPEPSSWMMLVTGFGLAGAALRRRRASLGSA